MQHFCHLGQSSLPAGDMATLIADMNARDHEKIVFSKVQWWFKEFHVLHADIVARVVDLFAFPIKPEWVDAQSIQGTIYAHIDTKRTAGINIALNWPEGCFTHVFNEAEIVTWDPPDTTIRAQIYYKNGEMVPPPSTKLANSIGYGPGEMILLDVGWPHAVFMPPGSPRRYTISINLHEHSYAFYWRLHQEGNLLR